MLNAPIHKSDLKRWLRYGVRISKQFKKLKSDLRFMSYEIHVFSLGGSAKKWFFLIKKQGGGEIPPKKLDIINKEPLIKSNSIILIQNLYDLNINLSKGIIIFLPSTYNKYCLNNVFRVSFCWLLNRVVQIFFYLYMHDPMYSQN